MRTSKIELPITSEGDGYTLRETVWGRIHVEIGTFYEELDVTPLPKCLPDHICPVPHWGLLKGLPDDICPVAHWGYVLKGRFRVMYKDSEEIVSAGDVFYMKPGHTVIFDADTEYVMFSPDQKQ